MKIVLLIAALLIAGTASAHDAPPTDRQHGDPHVTLTVLHDVSKKPVWMTTWVVYGDANIGIPDQLCRMVISRNPHMRHMSCEILPHRRDHQPR